MWYYLTFETYCSNYDDFFCYFTGDNNQIVTIVPSSTNPGEVSYVLIVEQSGENDKDDTVYDFNEADEGLSYVSVMLLC